MFSLQAVQHIGAAVLRVTIADGIPISKDHRGAYDVLNPLNWALIGDVQEMVITDVKTVGGDPYRYDLIAETAIDGGTWRLKAGDIRNVDGGSLLGQIILFEAVDTQNFFTNPRDQQSAEDIVRQAMAVTDGPGWRAMIAALGRGDEIVREQARSAFYQMFLATAGGVYLERLTTSYGVDKPPDVGFDDDQLRELTIALNANKVVAPALEAVLEAYYGIDATRIFVQTGIPEPFTLAIDDILSCEIDGSQLLITIDTATDFTNIATASAREVAVALNRHLTRAGLQAYATPFTDPATGLVYLRLYSGVPGFRGRLQFQGGRIWDALKLPTEPSTTQVVGTEWELQPSVPNSGIPSGRIRLSWTGGTDPNLQNVFAGDYINIWGAPFNAANRGIYPIVDTTSTWLEYEYDPNQSPVTQASVIQIADRDVFFVRPRLVSPDSRLFAAVVRPAPEYAEIILPATTSAVTRGLNRAWYLNGEQSVAVTAGVRAQGSTTLTLTTSTPHGLTAGQRFFLDSPIVDYTWSLPSDIDTAPTASAVYIDFSLVLTDGRILIVDYDKDYRLFDIDTQTWSTAATTGFTIAVLAPCGACLMADGRVFACSRNETRIYDPELDVWVAAAAPPRDKYFTQRAIMRLRDDRIIVIANDQAGGTGTWSDIYDPATNTWSDPLLITNAPAITGTVCQITPSGNIVMAGGNSGVESRVFYYNAEEGAWRQIANLPSPIMLGNMLFVPQGSGGTMWLTGINAAATPYNELYLLDLTTLTWSVRTTVQSFVWGCLAQRGAEVYLMSSANAGQPPNISWEVHDFTMPGSSGKRILVGTTTNTFLNQPMFEALPGGQLIEVGQNNLLSRIYLFYAPERTRAAGRLAQQHTVASMISPTQLTVTTDSISAVQLTSAIMTACRADIEGVRSGYALDVTQGVSLASGATALSVALNRGPTESVLNVVDTSGFPDEPGYIILDFGFASQSQPLRYLGVASATQLRIAAGQILTNDYAVASGVYQLIGTGPYAPETAADLGATYLTASSVGRIEAVKDIDFAKGAGLTILETVIYPGDKGLGNAGQPVSGVEKITDAVAVWGGDTVDEELAEARE